MHPRGIFDVFFSTSYVAVTVVMGALALAFTGIFFPETLQAMLRTATNIKAVLTNTGVPAKYNIWLQLLLEERQMLFAFYVIMTRFVLSALIDLAKWLVGWNR